MTSQATADPATLAVVVVASTRVRQERLTHVLGRRGVVVLAGARDAPSALAAVTGTSPDAVVLDVDVDGGGLSVVECVMAECPTPILLTGAAADDPSEALAAGAADVLDSVHERSGVDAFGAALADRLLLLSRVRVITHPRGRLRLRSADRESLAVEPAPTVPVPREPPPRSTDRGRLPLVLVGASTGGPAALATVLESLPEGLPAAVVVVQHMAEGFVSGLARWLDTCAALTVRVAQDGQRLHAGDVVLAPHGTNLLLDHGPVVRLQPAPASQLNVPAIDLTFMSAAALCRGRAVGVLLTGMGRDGAAGLSALRASGAITIAQDEATSAVWGMPGAASLLDAVDQELPLPRIAQGILAGVARLTAADGVSREGVS